MTAKQKPSRLSCTVTSALLRNKPDLRPSNREDKTSAGAGNIKPGTLPLAVLTYQPNKMNTASAIGVTTRRTRCVVACVLRARSISEYGFLVPPGAGCCTCSVSPSAVVDVMVLD